MKTKYTCPECNCGITVWFDMNVELQYNVKPGGTLSKVVVVSSDTGEERFGVKCQSCDWSVHGHDNAIEDYDALIKLAADKAEDVQLVAKGAKK